MEKIDNKKRDCVWVGIGVDISEKTKLYKTIIETNGLLVEKYGVKKDLTGSEHPHINLYDLSVTLKNLEAIVKKVEKIANIQKGFTVNVGAAEYFPFGVFFLKIENDDELKKLHSSIVKEVVKLKGECVDRDYSNPQRKYISRQKKLLAKYGNPHVLDQFYPHITIGHVKSGADILLAAQNDLNKRVLAKNIKIDNIYIVAEFKQGKKILAKFKLK